MCQSFGPAYDRGAEYVGNAWLIPTEFPSWRFKVKEPREPSSGVAMVGKNDVGKNDAGAVDDILRRTPSALFFWIVMILVLVVVVVALWDVFVVYVVPFVEAVRDEYF
jgi:hypothetical protein